MKLQVHKMHVFKMFFLAVCVILLCLIACIIMLITLSVFVWSLLQEIARKDRELEATIKRPAEADKYKMEKLAEANR